MSERAAEVVDTAATDWTTEGIVARREQFYAASQRKFVPYETPLIFRRGKGQYLWDETGKKYIDLLGMNLCISVGHAHPAVVQAGFARTGDNFRAFEADGVVPDIVVMAKGIGNGIPLGAVVARREIAECMADKFLFHTYGANPVACAVGRAVLRVIREEYLQENAREVGAALAERLIQLQQKYPVIGDVRGRGLMLAIECVKDRATREPDTETTARVFEATREEGLVVSKSGPCRSVLVWCRRFVCRWTMCRPSRNAWTAASPRL